MTKMELAVIIHSLICFSHYWIICHGIYTPQPNPRYYGVHDKMDSKFPPRLTINRDSSKLADRKIVKSSGKPIREMKMTSNQQTPIDQGLMPEPAKNYGSKWTQYDDHEMQVDPGHVDSGIWSNYKTPIGKPHNGDINAGYGKEEKQTKKDSASNDKRKNDVNAFEIPSEVQSKRSDAHSLSKVLSGDNVHTDRGAEFLDTDSDKLLKQTDYEKHYEKPYYNVEDDDYQFPAPEMHTRRHRSDRDRYQVLTEDEISLYPKLIHTEYLVRKEVQKELLEHSIQFLKGRLVKCMQKSDRRMDSRGKRKAAFDYSFIALEVDMDVLDHSKEFLLEKLVNCRTETRLLPSSNDRDPIQWQSGVPDFAPEPPPYSNRMYGVHIDKPLTTTPKPKIKETGWLFPVADHELWVQEAHVLENNTLQFRNVQIDRLFRLPNQDVCIPYDRDDWRDSTALQPRVAMVLDLLSLCETIAHVVKVWGYVLRSRVIWDCGEVENRVKWLNGAFAGSVEDNGFLRDLECMFSDRVPSIHKFNLNQ